MVQGGEMVLRLSVLHLCASVCLAPGCLAWLKAEPVLIPAPGLLMMWLKMQ